MIRYGKDLYDEARSVIDNIGNNDEWHGTDGEKLLRFLDKVVAAQLAAAGIQVPKTPCECDIVGNAQGESSFHLSTCELRRNG